MLGETVDYHLLRLFAHDRNRATDADLANYKPRFDREAVRAKFAAFNQRIGGRFPIGSHLRYLDVACGDGSLSVGVLLAGGGYVTAIESVARTVKKAHAKAAAAGVLDRSEFLFVDIHKWNPASRYDVVFSNEALEHVARPAEFLHHLGDFVKPGGVIILGFGPLFHSPLGDHMWGFFRVPVPWRGVLFSEPAMLRVRREMYRPSETVARYEDMADGLNRLRYSEFLKYAAADYDFELLRVNPQLQRIPPLYAASKLATRIPLVRDYVATSVYAILRKRAR